MKHIVMLVGLVISLALPSWVVAQTAQPAYNSDRYGMDHGEVGVYGDYLRFSPGKSATNFVGVDALAGINVHPNLALEAQMSYDFARNFSTTTSNGITSTTVTSSVRPITGLFGPKLQLGTGGPFRAFVTCKVGFIDFSVNNSGVVSGNTFANGVAGVGGAGTHLALYPGGGVEAFAGWLGLRLEAGDEIYLNSGTYNNLRVAFGPTFRF